MSHMAVVEDEMRKYVENTLRHGTQAILSTRELLAPTIIVLSYVQEGGSHLSRMHLQG